MATRKHFTKEFKLEAVRLIEHSGKSGTELARQLGVRRNQIYKWQSELRGKAERAFPGRGQHPESADELTRLQPSRTGMNATMIKFGRFLPVILALVFSLTAFAADTSGVGNNSEPAGSAEKSGGTRNHLEELLNAYQGFLTNKNVDAILELYSADPVFMPEYAPPAVGREAVRKAYEWVFANLNLEGKFIFHEAEVIGDSAWLRTNSTGRLTIIATGAKADVANSEFFLFKREDGAWRIHRYIFTASAPPPQAK